MIKMVKLFKIQPRISLSNHRRHLPPNQLNKIKINRQILRNHSLKDLQCSRIKMTLKMLLYRIELSRMTTIQSSRTQLMRNRTHHSHLKSRKLTLAACMLSSVPNYTINVCSLMAVQVTKKHSLNCSKLRNINNRAQKSLSLSTRDSLTTGTDLDT